MQTAWRLGLGRGREGGGAEKTSVGLRASEPGRCRHQGCRVVAGGGGEEAGGLPRGLGPSAAERERHREKRRGSFCEGGAHPSGGAGGEPSSCSPGPTAPPQWHIFSPQTTSVGFQSQATSFLFSLHDTFLWDFCPLRPVSAREGRHSREKRERT